MPEPRVLAAWLAVSTAVLACACSSATGPRGGSHLLGTWSWVEASGGIAGVTNTPESTGTTMTLILGPSGEARLLRSDAPDRVVAYEVVDVTTVATSRAWEIRYDPPLLGFETQRAAMTTEDELVLIDPCCDGFVWRFERIR